MIQQKLSSCVKGKLKPLSSVSDPVFSQGMLGEDLQSRLQKELC